MVPEVRRDGIVRGSVFHSCACGGHGYTVTDRWGYREPSELAGARGEGREWHGCREAKSRRICHHVQAMSYARTWEG